MKHLLLYLFLLISLSGWAQTLTGQVADTSGFPLLSASVVAKGAANSVIAFARTDSDGHFALNIPQGKLAIEIEFNLLGFGRKVVQLKDFKNGQKIELDEKAIALREVKVRPQ